jgi:hypothetical protein
VLNDQEQRSWNEIERSYAAGPDTRAPGGGQPAPARGGDRRGSEGVLALAVGAVGLAIMSVFVGAPVAGLVIVAAPALGWVLWRYWRDIGDACATAVVPMGGWVTDGESSRPPRRAPGAD